jgi:AhpD family alkylhydroperoxidase
MENRLDMAKTQPAAYHAMLGLEKYLGGTQLTDSQKDLIKIRASQINKCAYCLGMHTTDARKHGETEQRIYLLNAWRETTLYTEEERTLLALTEEITLISEHGVPDEIYQKALTLFGEVPLAQIIMAIVVINAWNRIGITLHMQPS